MTTLAFTGGLLIARAGGGGGHGGGGHFSGGGGHSYASSGYYGGRGGNNFSGIYANYPYGSSMPSEVLIFIFFVVVIWFAYMVYTSKLLYRKWYKAEAIVQQSAEEDDFWRIKYLKIHAKEIFRQMQNAWSDGNLDNMKSKITPELYGKYTVMLEDMKVKGEKNVVRDIKFDDVKIISCEDYRDNTKDKYIAYITGSLIDYTLCQGKIIKNPLKERENFIDTYHFVREGNRWKLDNITNDPGFWTLLDAKSIFEKK